MQTGSNTETSYLGGSTNCSHPYPQGSNTPMFILFQQHRFCAVQMDLRVFMHYQSHCAPIFSQLRYWSPIAMNILGWLSLLIRQHAGFDDDFFRKCRCLVIAWMNIHHTTLRHSSTLQYNCAVTTLSSDIDQHDSWLTQRPKRIEPGCLILW